MKCKHEYIVIEWQLGSYKEGKFVLRTNEINGNISPIKKASKLICRKCLEIVKVG